MSTPDNDPKPQGDSQPAPAAAPPIPTDTSGARPAPPAMKTREAFEPLEKTGWAASFESLLKRPGSVIYEMHNDGRRKLTLSLILTLLISLGLYGLAVGSLSMGNQLWIAPVKIILGVFISGIICLPSLYIFSCLNGLDIRLGPVTGVLVAVLCLASLLLLGFAPVVWVFSQSTNSAIFMGLLNLAFWFVAVFGGMVMLSRMANYLGVTRRTHLYVWVMVFLLVSLQMTSSLRPILGTSDKFFPTEKKFFLVHWMDSLQTASDVRRGETKSEGENAEEE